MAHLLTVYGVLSITKIASGICFFDSPHLRRSLDEIHHCKVSFHCRDAQTSVMEPFTGPNTEGNHSKSFWHVSMPVVLCLLFTVVFAGSCIEKRTFYRAISGLHSSINIHLSAKYLLSGE